MLKSQEVCSAMLHFASNFRSVGMPEPLTLENFTDGIPFALMVIDGNCLQLSMAELQLQSSKWIVKVSNLKKVLSKIHTFLERVNQKSLRIFDIDVVQIAKNADADHIANFFQLVMTVLMNSLEKERYIQMIMAMDQKLQNIFVAIIQNSIDETLLKSQNGSSISNFQEEIRQLKNQNTALKTQIGQLIKKNKHMGKQIKDLKDQVFYYEEELQQFKMSDYSTNSDGLQTQIEQQRTMIDNLKTKLIATVREAEIQNSRLRDEISILRIKLKNMDEIEGTLELYKEKYNESVTEIHKFNEWEKEKRRLNRLIDEKELIIKKLQEKIDTTVEKNYSMQENQLYMKLQLEKRQARFKQLEKEVKTRLKSEPCEVAARTDMFQLQAQDEKDEISYLQSQLSKLKTSMKEAQKQNIKNRKKLEKMGQLQTDKKKLQKIVLQVNRCKDSEIEILLVSLFELRNENIRMYEMIRASGKK